VVLGVAGVFSSFGMFWIGEIWLKLDHATIQTLMFLKLSVAGHMTIYLTRTGEHPFWRRPLPSAALFWTSELTQLIATLVAVYGVFMEPLGWSLALLVWGYAFAWFLFNDLIKVHAYRLITHGAKRERRHIERYTENFHTHGTL